MSESHTKKAKRTCRTVAGTLTPLSSYMLVIPRFRVMRPVRIEFGVHLGAVFVVSVANLATVELKCLALVDGDRLHSRNIGGDGVEGLRECSDPAETRPAAHLNGGRSCPPPCLLPTRQSRLEMSFYTLGLASIELTCLAAVLYLQLVIPGKFTVEESTTETILPAVRDNRGNRQPFTLN